MNPLKGMASFHFDLVALRQSRRSAVSIAPLKHVSQFAYDPDVFQGIFGNGKFARAMSMDCWKWGVFLHEPQITRGLCHVINETHCDANLLSTAINRVGVPREKLINVTRWDFIAENNKIDIIARGYDILNTVVVSIIIEAKIRHHITNGQLSKYYKTDVGGGDCYYIVLAPNRSVMKSLRGSQFNIWNFVSWRRFIHVILQSGLTESSEDLAAFFGILLHQIEVQNNGGR